MKRKGIILAGGKGTRLYPCTKSLSKQLLSVYDKPMIYYPLTTLMLAGIDEILIICNREHLIAYQALLGSGENWGISIFYKIQDKPNGIAEAFILGEKFLNGSPVCLILGDNIFFGQDFPAILQTASLNQKNALIFAYQVNDPENYGVAEFDTSGNVIGLQEKPTNPKSDFAITGIYFYNNDVVKRAKRLTPSSRGELEITDLNNSYLKDGKLKLVRLSRGFAWLDTGTAINLLEASNFVHAIEKRQGLKIACPEEVALNMGFISSENLKENIKDMPSCEYKNYLNKLLSYLSI